MKYCSKKQCIFSCFYVCKVKEIPSNNNYKLFVKNIFLLNWYLFVSTVCYDRYSSSKEGSTVF